LPRPPESPKHRRAAVIFILITVVLDMLALGVVIPVFPRLVLGFLGGDTARAAEIYGLFGSVWALMQFLFSPLLGALSDRFGRRPVILVSVFGLGLDYVLMAMAPSLAWLFVGRTISGITSANVGTASAYIADVTEASERAKAFGMIGVAFGLGFVLGPALGGILGGADPRLPFWVAAALTLSNGVYGLFVLPESLPKERRAALELERANPLGALGFLRAHPQLLGLSTVGFLANLAHAALPSTFVLYAGYRYGWHEREVGWSLAGVGICSALVQGTLIGPIVRRLGERRSLLLGLALGALGFLAYALARTGAEFWLGVPMVAFWGIAGPAAQSLMTRRVDPTEQGRLQGATSSLNGVASLIGPLVFSASFAYFIRPGAHLTLPGAPFLLASACLFSAMLVAWKVTQTS
jgi:DHA1 family tetracycline resistance protein-like MFS transporter